MNAWNGSLIDNKAVACFIVFLLAGVSHVFSSMDYQVLQMIINSVWAVLINLLFAMVLYRFVNVTVCTKSFAKELLALLFIALTNIIVFATVYRFAGINSGECVTHGVWETLYFSIVTWTTLGYGDFSPTEGVRFVAALEALLGYTYMAILVGIFLTIFNRKPES